MTAEPWIPLPPDEPYPRGQVETCECDHALDEHLTLGSRPCGVDECPCVAYQEREG